MPDLLVTIGADASQYNKSMADAATTASNTASGITSSMSAADNATKSLGSTAISTSMQFQQMRSGISAARDGVMALSVGGQSADRYLMAFGHHLTTLTSETGSFGGALSSLAGSLWGAGGIILALSVAVELWNKYSKGQKTAKKETDDYVKSLDSVNQAQLKGEQNGQEEIVRLGILYNATQNHTLSLKSRNEAYDELEKKYPTYFTNSEREKTLLGENANAYNVLAGAIMAAAYAKAYENQIGVNAGKIDVAQSQRYGMALQLREAQQALADAKKNVTLQSQVGGAGAGGIQIALGVEREAALKVAEVLAQINAFKQTELNLTKQNAELSQRAAAAEQAAGYKTVGDDGKKGPKSLDAYAQLEKAVKEAQDAVNVALTNGSLKADDFGNALNRNLQSLRKELADVKSSAESLDSGLGHGVKGAGTEGGNAGAFKPDSNNADDFAKSLLEQNSAFNANSEAISKNIAYWRELKISGGAAEDEYKQTNKTIQDLTTSIGRGLVGAFDQALNGTQSFVQAMEQFFLQLIEKMISAIAVALILAAVLEYTGLGAVAGASSATFSGEFSQLLGGLAGGGGVKLASGGIVTGPTRALVGEGGEPEAVMPLSKLQKFVNTGSQNGNISNGQIIGVLSGPNLLLKWQTRAEKQRGRVS